jgi:hypothetical protein
MRKAAVTLLSETKTLTNIEVIERPKAKVLATRNAQKAALLLKTAKPSSTPWLWYPPGNVKAAVKVTVAMSVATNKLVSLSCFTESDSAIPLPSPAFRMPNFKSAPIRLGRAPLNHNLLMKISFQFYKLYEFVKEKLIGYSLLSFLAIHTIIFANFLKFKCQTILCSL